MTVFWGHRDLERRIRGLEIFVAKLGVKVAASQQDIDNLTQELQDETSALNTAVVGIQAEIVALQNANPGVDVTALQAAADALKASVDSAAALVPPVVTPPAE